MVALGSLPGDRNLDEKLAEDPGSLDKFLSPEDKNKAMIQGPPFGSSRSESIVIRQYPDGVSRLMWLLAGKGP